MKKIHTKSYQTTNFSLKEISYVKQMILIFPHFLETLNTTCYIPIVGTIMNLRVYERHTSIAWVQMSLTLVSFISNSNGDKVDREFWLLVLLMYCFPQIASEKLGCIPDG